MSRVIKFRVWDTYLKMMFNWEEVKNSGYELESVFELVSVKTMQFTGFKDKNDVEIYESDLIAIDDESSLFSVVFEDGAYRKKYQGWDETLPKPVIEKYMIKLLGMRVVGNTYENEKLLTRK